ncbi:MAG TPA: hypothetical protein VGN17_04940 [Bryobacteraceae bacterium]|jgi:hypothetical protein
MRFRIVDFPERKVSVGKVLTLSDDQNRLRITVHRCVQADEAHLTITVGSRWRATFGVEGRRFHCTVTELCQEVRACSAAATQVGLPTLIQHCLDETAYALAAYIAELPPDEIVFAEVREATWAKGRAR